MADENVTAGADKALAKAEEVRKEPQGAALADARLRSLVPQSFGEMQTIASYLAKSDIVPKEMIGKPANVLLAVMFGAELGMSPAQALQNIMVVNGRPSLWGDALMGKVEASGLMESWTEAYDDKLDGGTHSFTVTRRGRSPVTRTFSMADARRAGLDKKPGPWTQYPRRMLFHRARSWALRDTFPDVLKGIGYYEEMRDVITLEKDRTGYYSMPKPAAGPANPGMTLPAGKVEAPAAAAAAAPVQAVDPGTVVHAELDEAYLVHSVAKTELKDKTVAVVRLDGVEGKLYTDQAGIEQMLRDAVKAEPRYAVVVLWEKRDGVLWITEAARATAPAAAGA